MAVLKLEVNRSRMEEEDGAIRKGGLQENYRNDVFEFIWRVSLVNLAEMLELLGKIKRYMENQANENTRQLLTGGKTIHCISSCDNSTLFCSIG